MYAACTGRTCARLRYTRQGNSSPLRVVLAPFECPIARVAEPAAGLAARLAPSPLRASPAVAVLARGRMRPPPADGQQTDLPLPWRRNDVRRQTAARSPRAPGARWVPLTP